MKAASTCDVPTRRKCASLLKRAALGRVTKDECETCLLDLLSRTDDPVVFALYRTLFELGGEAERVPSAAVCDG